MEQKTFVILLFIFKINRNQLNVLIICPIYLRKLEVGCEQIHELLALIHAAPAFHLYYQQVGVPISTSYARSTRKLPRPLHASKVL